MVEPPVGCVLAVRTGLEHHRVAYVGFDREREGDQSAEGEAAVSGDGEVKKRPTCTSCLRAPAAFRMRMVSGGSWTVRGR